jgi:carboxymethylenebutenolidase
VIDAAVDFYGIHPKVTIVPEKLAKVPVQGHFATRDKSVSLEVVRKLEEGVKRAGGSFEVHAYEADHAFFNDTRVTVFDGAAATLAFARTLTFLHHELS